MASNYSSNEASSLSLAEPIMETTPFEQVLNDNSQTAVTSHNKVEKNSDNHEESTSETSPMVLVTQTHTDIKTIEDDTENNKEDIINVLSEFLDGYSTFSTSTLAVMPAGIINPKEAVQLKAVGNIDDVEKQENENIENQVNNPVSSVPDYSDGEDEYFNSDMENCEETPSLHLREYQKELSQNALKGRNTIICAPTGSGKTRVATHIILSHLLGKDKDAPVGENETSESAGSKTRTRKVAFLARTVPLVMQQCKSLKKYLPRKFEVTSLTGDSEDSMHLHMILLDTDVIVMTPRILENHLKRKLLSNLGVFSMMIFDECHHTRKGEPYNTLMYSYLVTKKSIKDKKANGEITDIKLPQIVGLTASISVEGAVDVDEAVKYILQVCGNLDVEVISTVKKNLDELQRTVPVPEEKLEKLREVEDDVAVNKIKNIMQYLEKVVIHKAKEIKNDHLDALVKKIPADKKCQQYGQWAVKIRNIVKTFPRMQQRETISSVRALIIIADYLSAYNIALELHELVLMDHVIKYLEKCFVEFSQNEKASADETVYFNHFIGFKNLMQHRLNSENPNLIILKRKLIENLIEKGNKSCGIIFVRTRSLTEAIASWLNTCGNKDLENLKATPFTGTGASVDEGGMTTTEQDEVLRRFNSGDIRLLVATSVGEEGIDIAECNLVIKYNHVGNEVTTVQTRGRSRKAGGMSILLAMEKILRKERINQEKSKLMVRAIAKISELKRKEVRKKNNEHQQKILKQEEISQIVKRKEKSCLIRKDFKMVCFKCRKVVIDSKDIKTIYDTHHVVVNREILSQTKTIPFKKAKYWDEMKVVGTVRCRGAPEEGKLCFNKLGQMMLYSQLAFVVLGIENFGFDLGNSEILEFYNKWIKVPYAIDEIDVSDFERYLHDSAEDGNNNETNSKKLTSSSADSDGDSDSDSGDDSDDDDDDDKVNKSTSKSVENVEPSSRDLANTKLVFSDDHANTTENKTLPPTHKVSDSEINSRTDPKGLQNCTDRKVGLSRTNPEEASKHKLQTKQQLGNQSLLNDSKLMLTAVSLESKFSTFKPVEEESLPPYNVSISSESEESESSFMKNSITSAAGASQTGGNIASKTETSLTENNNPSAPETSPRDNNVASVPEHSEREANVAKAPETSQTENNVSSVPETSQRENNVSSVPETSQGENNVSSVPETSQSVTNVASAPETSQRDSSISSALETSQREATISNALETSQRKTNVVIAPHTSQRENIVLSAPETSQRNNNISSALETSQRETNISYAPETLQREINVASASQTSQRENIVLSAPETSQRDNNNASAPETSQRETNISNAPEILQRETKVSNAPESSQRETNISSTPETLQRETKISNAPESSQRETNISSTPETLQRYNNIALAPETSQSEKHVVSALETSQRDNNVANATENSQKEINIAIATERSQVNENLANTKEIVEVFNVNATSAQSLQLGAHYASTTEASRRNSKDNEDTTIPKEVLSEMIENYSVELRQSRQQSLDSDSPSNNSLNFLNLL